MILLKLKDRYLNLSHLVDAQVLRGKDGSPALRLVFNAPESSSVGASDWVTGAYTVTLRGLDAMVAHAWLEGRWDRDGADDPSKPTIAPWPELIGEGEGEGEEGGPA